MVEISKGIEDILEVRSSAPAFELMQATIERTTMSALAYIA